MKSIIKAITDNGMNPKDIQLSGMFQHTLTGLQLNEAESGLMTFEPVIKALSFTHKDHLKPVFLITQDENYHLSHPPSMQADEVGILVKRVMVDNRVLTGSVLCDYPIHITAPDLNKKEMGKKHRLSVSLTKQISYIEIDEELMTTIISSPDSPERKSKIDDLTFKKFSLTKSFEVNPCEQPLYLMLMKEHKDLWMTGVSKEAFYNWYWDSKKTFDNKGDLSRSVEPRFTAALKAWLEINPSPSAEFIADKQRLARRLFEVHPQHEALMDSVVKRALSLPPRASIASVASISL